MRLRSRGTDSGPGDQSLVESLRKFSYMFPPNMMVIVFCTSPDSMYPGNLTRTVLERGRLSARSADSPLSPNPAEKTRIRTSSGAEGGYLGSVWREVSLSCFRPMRSMDTPPALEGIIDGGMQQRPTQPPTGGGLSWWLLPLRGGHGGGLRRFAAVMAEVFAPSWRSRRRSFDANTKTTQKFASHATSACFLQEHAWGLRLFAALAPPGEFSAKS